MPFDPVDSVLDDLADGRMVVLLDDEQRENEGDLVCAGQFVTPDVVNFMLTHGRGMLFVAVAGEVADRLDLPPQTAHNTTQQGTAYTISVDAHARFGVTTGVSAGDRAATVHVLADPASTPADLARPGHIQPVRARTGGVLVRTGHTEGMIDLCEMAGLQGVALGIEVMNDDGSMARLDDLQALCAAHQLKMCSVADVIAKRVQRDKLIERVGEAPFATEYGQFRLVAYRSAVDPLPHVALTLGRVGGQTDIGDPVLVRMHSQNLLGDVFGDIDQPSGRTLHAAMRRISDAGEGAIVYLRQDGMGTGLLAQLQTLEDTHASHRRQLRSAMNKLDFGVGCQILRDLGIRRLRLITNHPRHLHGLDGFGLSIAEHVPVEPAD